MVLSQAQLISIIINSIMFFVAVGASGLLIWKLNFKDRNSRLLFILYALYWMSPLLCREYTGQMHLHMEYIVDYGRLLYIPLIAYGVIGLFWRPLSDIFSLKFKSRKKVIYLSLILQALTIIPFLVYPCFSTNIIQSVGAGIGASCIGLFNLMFDETYHHQKVYKTMSIIAVPPLIAELITSILEAIICSFLTEGREGRYKSYTGVMIYVWVLALIFVVASFVVTLFIKEQNKATIIRQWTNKEAVKKPADWWVVALICIAGAGILFVRWITAGPAATTQLIYMGYMTDVDTRFIEAYLTVMYAAGQIVGVILSGLWLSKSKQSYKPEKILLIAIASIIWVLYLATISAHPTVWVYFFANIFNGLAMGLIWAVFTGMMINKAFAKTKLITPMGVLNTFLSLGICLGTFFNCYVKGSAWDFAGATHHGLDYADFVKANANVNYVCALIIVGVLVCMVIAYALHNKFPPTITKVQKASVTGETEM